MTTGDLLQGKLQTKRNCHALAWGAAGLLGGMLLGILINLKPGSSESRSSYVVQGDHNADGKPDVAFHYDRGILVRAEYDRNFDGKPDYFEWYEDGIVSRGETDDDFDGEIDGWLSYRNGNLWLSKHNTDRNGVPDVFQHFEHGVIKMAVWRPNEAGQPTRIEIYEHGVKAKVFRDTTGDGLLDTVAGFDAFENAVNEEKLREPLNAEDVITGGDTQ